MDEIQQGIKNLELMSSALERAACQHGGDYGYYLDQISFDCHLMAQELKSRSEASYV